MQETGCVSCIQLGIFGNPGDVHHLLYAGKRISHQHTICLCTWHHRGHHDVLSDKLAYERFGPSLAKTKKEFHDKFGDNEDLLWFQNELLRRVEESIV